MKISINNSSEKCISIFTSLTVGTKFEVDNSNASITVQFHIDSNRIILVATHKEYEISFSINGTDDDTIRSISRSCIVHLSRLHAHRQIVVPLAIIIDKGKILVSKRIDPMYKEMDGKWEFPGGGVEQGEHPDEALIREVKEEVGLDVHIEKRFEYIHLVTHPHSSLYIMPFLCTIKGGNPECLDGEVSEITFVTLEEFYRLPLMAENDILMKKIESEIREYLSYVR